MSNMPLGFWKPLLTHYYKCTVPCTKKGMLTLRILSNPKHSSILSDYCIHRSLQKTLELAMKNWRGEVLVAQWRRHGEQKMGRQSKKQTDDE